MAAERHVSKRLRTLEDLTIRRVSSGFLVCTRCVAISTHSKARYELILEAGGQRSVVDVSESDADSLHDRLDQAISVFAASLKLRQ